MVSILGIIIGIAKPHLFDRWFKGNATRGKVAGAFGALTFVFFVLFGLTSGSRPAQPAKTVAENQTKQEDTKPAAEQKAPAAEDDQVQIGDDAFLRLPGISDPEQVICLGSTKEEFEQVSKALLAKDTLGLFDLPGAFCVSNGSRVKVIDSAFGVRRVRITAGVRNVDNDKIGTSGWTAKEWVVKQ